MAHRSRLLVVNRRDLVLGAGASALAAFLASIPRAETAERSPQFEAAFKALLEGAVPREGGIEMDLPEAIENGEHVPVALSVVSPMTPEDHVRALHLLSTANPRATVATFRFTPLSGRARVTSRMRLAKSQDVIAVAELSDGTLLMGTRRVAVKIGGCGI